jgi:hypothetical protein
MCPACLASAAWLIAGTASAGGLTAVAVKRLRSKRRGATAASGEHGRDRSDEEVTP